MYILCTLNTLYAIFEFVFYDKCKTIFDITICSIQDWKLVTSTPAVRGGVFTWTIDNQEQDEQNFAKI